MPSRSDIPVAEARRFVLDKIERLESESVPLLDALERVLDEELVARRAIPPWDNSAMDGYALRAEDARAGTTLEVIEEIFAGDMPTKTIGPGQAAKIMTGAPVPPGATVVVQVELTKDARPGSVTLTAEGKLPARGDNIRRAGEDVLAGARVVPRGTVMTPAAIGVAASLGVATLRVIRRPRVAVLSTGDEIAEVGTEPTAGQIWSSNSHSLCSAITRAGGVPVYLGIARDTREDLHAKLAQAKGCDAVLTTGGVSVGEADFVKEVLKALGAEMEFWRVAQRPGYPLAFGLLWGKPVFGLPGNPVSTLVSFEEYVLPSLLKMQGRVKLHAPVVRATLEEDVSVKPGKTYFLRGILRRDGETFRVRTTGSQSSGVLTSMLLGNALIVIPESSSGAKKGDTVAVQVVDPGFWLSDTAGF